MQDTQRFHRVYGPYTCVRVMAITSNHTIYYAIHRDNGRLVALRVMPIVKNNKAEILAACEEQLELFKGLDTPYIIPIEDYGSDDENLYMAMEIMKGGTLEQRMKQADDGKKHPLPSLGEVGQLLERLALALDYLHERDIVHGQIEPRSIMFDEAGDAYLADVGLTRLFKLIYGLETTNSFNMSRYSAPELWEGLRPEPASDQYSVACILYELITGRPPFDDRTIYGLMQQHKNDPAMPLHHIRKDVPPASALPFWQALAKPLPKRHPNMWAFYQDYISAVAGFEGTPTGYFTFSLDDHQIDETSE